MLFRTHGLLCIVVSRIPFKSSYSGYRPTRTTKTATLKQHSTLDHRQQPEQQIMTAPSQDQLKAIEQIRQRLVQLTHSLGSLIASLNQSDPLPSWSSLQSQASIISNNLLTSSSLLREYQSLFSSLVAYPSPSYPTKTQANILEQLLRTKLDPRVEDWVSRGRAVGVDSTSSPSSVLVGGGDENRETVQTTAGEASRNLTEEELEELWSWAPLEANQEARRRNWGGDFTLEEIEGGVDNVVTGLKRELEVNSEVEGEEEEEEYENGSRAKDGMVSVQELPHRGVFATGPEREMSEPGLGLDEVLKFMTTGSVSSGR